VWLTTTGPSRTTSGFEAGLVPFPHHESSSPLPGFTLDWEGGGNGFQRARVLPQAWCAHQERKKGIPWTEEEHG
jgi:hypothetical protein